MELKKYKQQVRLCIITYSNEACGNTIRYTKTIMTLGGWHRDVASRIDPEKDKSIQHWPAIHPSVKVEHHRTEEPAEPVVTVMAERCNSSSITTRAPHVSLDREERGP